MTYKELRIGNYILQDGEEIHGIVGLTIYKFSIGQIILEPIPITKEWLLKFGFEYNHISGEYKGHNMIFFNRISYITWGTTKIYYVHQLQNLYFALTGEELIINN